MVVYSGRGKSKGIRNMWTPENLMKMRDFEKDVRRNKRYKRTCLSSAEKVGQPAVCSDKAFLSPLDLISDPDLLENTTQQDLDNILLGVMANQ